MLDLFKRVIKGNIASNTLFYKGPHGSHFMCVKQSLIARIAGHYRFVCQPQPHKFVSQDMAGVSITCTKCANNSIAGFRRPKVVFVFPLVLIAPRVDTEFIGQVIFKIVQSVGRPFCICLLYTSPSPRDS